MYMFRVCTGNSSVLVAFVQEQYIFVYDAILEALKCGNTAISCINLRQNYAKLLKISAETGKTFCEKEFEVYCCLI